MKSSLLQKYHISFLEDIIGQNNNISFLKNSLFKNVFYPLYLFSGMRGSGKTTCARLFSLSLLCEKLSDFQQSPLKLTIPCYSCYSCNLYKQNKHPDIIELDAASHNGIETIRSVIDNAHMLPVICKKKIYIIDEVHMLSKSAFNACLKIMEEPPENVHFILATTEINKVIDTIKSRSIILNFKPISKTILFDYLKNIINKENITTNDKVINYIIEISEGSVRDALNILNRLIMIDEKITEKIIIDEYGIIEKNEIENLLKNILEDNFNEYYEIKNKLNLAELGKKKFFEYAVLYIQKLLEDEYINKKNYYKIDILNKILLSLYNYEELFFTSQNPLGIFDLLLEKNKNTTIENNYIENKNIDISKNLNKDLELSKSISQINQEILNFINNLETVVNTILSQGNISIDHENNKMKIILKKNFSFYKDFLLSKNNHISDATKKTFGNEYQIEYFFEDIEINNNIKNKTEIKNIQKIDTSSNNKKIVENDSFFKNNKKEIIEKKTTPNNNSENKKIKNIPQEKLGPLLKHVNTLFPGETYIEKE